MVDDPTSIAETTPGDEGHRLLGARLHELRRMRGLKLKDVADSVGVSPSFLSMVERGQTDLSEFYDIRPSELLMELRTTHDAPRLGRLDEHPSIPRGPGVEYRLLQAENPQMIHVRLEPGARFTDMRAHRGEDFWVALEGAPRLHYGEDEYDLATGETARFSSTIPHGLSNPGSVPAVLVALCSVPYW
jgi:mannose-6-phosphate isomerase-like protein (cupin superfamily)/DNA-binding XRE family transcriptional regulator